MEPRFCQRLLQKYGFSFQENLIYLKTKISPKFHNFLFLSYFFSIFYIFFYFTYQNLTKNYSIFSSVLLEGLEILSVNSRNF